jgi:hypothetical protein
MRRVRAFGAFWYDFVVGDDWRIAVGVVVGLAGTALLVHAGHVQAWWLLPAIVLIGLAGSLRLATRTNTAPQQGSTESSQP